MRVAIDGGSLTGGSAGRGIGVYTRLLVDALKKPKFASSGIDVEVVDAKNLESLKAFDLLHYPYFDFFFPTLPFRHKIPVVVTVHDTIPLIFPKHYPPGLKGKLVGVSQRMALRRVSAVITDSKTSQKDVIRFLGVKSNKVTPVYLGPTVSVKNVKRDKQRVLDKYNIKFPYVLYIGDVNWNKNVINLAAACENAKLHLVLVGKKAVSEQYDRNHIENRPLSELQARFKNSKFVHFVGFVPDEDLPTIISAAKILCQPSFYEGFGLSVLDAMSIGTPTVCAKTQVFVELYEEASVFFDPYDVNNIAEKLVEVFFDKKLGSDLIKKGKSLSGQFSWEKAAKETIDVYKSILK